MWTVYERPLDYPQGYAARQWLATAQGEEPTDAIIYAETFEQIEAFFIMTYPHMIFMTRSDGDPPQIVGTWL
jgi:hypothetical protein